MAPGGVIFLCDKASEDSSLLPLWEKLTLAKRGSHEGSLSAETDPSPVFAEFIIGRRSAPTRWRSHPLPQGERETETLSRGVRETVGLELVAQRGLQDLARRGVRNGIDEHDVVGHPPFGDLAVHEFQDVLTRCILPLLELHDQKRTLVPFGMGHDDT